MLHDIVRLLLDEISHFTEPLHIHLLRIRNIPVLVWGQNSYSIFFKHLYNKFIMEFGQAIKFIF